MNKPLTRAEVAIETTWNLADLFSTREEWLAELAAVEQSLESVVRHQGRLATGPTLFQTTSLPPARMRRPATRDRYRALRTIRRGSPPAPASAIRASRKM